MLSYANTVGRSNPVGANYITVITFKIKHVADMHCNALSLHLALPLSLVGVTKGLYDRFEHPDCIMVFCLLTFI